MALVSVDITLHASSIDYVVEGYAIVGASNHVLSPSGGFCFQPCALQTSAGRVRELLSKSS